MQFFVLKPVNGFRTLAPKSGEAWDVLQAFDGKQRFAADWIPLEVKYAIDRPSDERRPKSAFPLIGLSSVLVLSNEAKLLLQKLLLGHGELLPLDCDGERYWAFNTLNLVDVVDLDRSEVDYFEDDRTEILNIRRYALKSLDDFSLPIFKVPQMNSVDIFVSEDFRKVVEDAKLDGLAFQEVD